MKRYIVIDTCCHVISENTILPSSVRVNLVSPDTIKSVHSPEYYIDNNMIIFPDHMIKQYGGCTLEIAFRSFDFNIGKTYALLDSALLERKDRSIYIGYDYTFSENDVGSIFNAKTLRSSGSFSRGFSFGNSQSLVLNSRFDLQLAGDLGEGLMISAAISDDNVPIQAQGNTLVLQEFDRVFIEVSKDRTAINAGDFVLRSEGSYFMQYYKKLKGIGASNIAVIGDNIQLKNKVNVTSSRGKFARQQLQTTEGNQGPYRLRGNNNERFIIVLSGTERVYFDGILLKRGLENDYVIDYQSAEITFTANRLISRERRIIIDFEYTDLNYFRTLYTASSQLTSDKLEINFNYYTEQDSKNATGQLELDSVDIRIMREAGDDLSLLRRSGIRGVTAADIQPGAILYQIIPNPDFPADPNPVILQFSTDPLAERFLVFFTELGQGEGSYDIDPAVGVNGRVYKYVGARNGRYEPIIELIPPEKKQMITGGVRYHIAENLKLSSELAFSNFDLNRFSDIGNQDNQGIAGFFEFEGRIKIDSSGNSFLKNQTKLELLQKNFKPLNPYRPAEFARDWNYRPDFRAEENLLESISLFQIDKNNQISYNLSRFAAGSFFEGWRHGISTNLNFTGFRLISKINLTKSDFVETKNKFFRPSFDFSRTLFNESIKLGVWYDGEANRGRNIQNDSLSLRSYAYDYIKYYLSTNPEKLISGSVSVNRRVDRFSDGSQLRNAIKINEFEVTGRWDIPGKSNFNISVKSRDFYVENQELVPKETNKRTFLGAIDHQLNLWSNLIVSNLNYQINSGQEPKVEFIFQQVDVGRGEYLYVGDENDEVKNIVDFRFDPGNPLANYIRIVLPNNEFIRTNNKTLNQSLRIDPQSYWRDKDKKLRGFTKQLAKLSTLSSVRISLRGLDDGGGRIINFFDFSLNDTNLVAYSSLISNSIFYNRGNPKYDVQINFRNNSNRNNQVNGNEVRGLKERDIRLRWNFLKNTDFIITAVEGAKNYEVALFQDRNFNIGFYRIIPEINFRYSPEWRFVFNGRFENREQRINGKERARSTELSLAINHRKTNLYALDLKLSAVRISYMGEANTPIEFDLLEGLKNGNNFLWNVNYTRRLGGRLDLSLNYEGRKTGLSPIVHVGRAQVKATF